MAISVGSEGRVRPVDHLIGLLNRATYFLPARNWWNGRHRRSRPGDDCCLRFGGIL